MDSPKVSKGGWWVSYRAGGHFGMIRVVILSNLVRAAFPPLFLSSIPRRAIGFSYPSGNEGIVLGSVLVVATGLIGTLLSTLIGLLGFALMLWAMGGTAILMLYNSIMEPVAFVKQSCSACRLRPLIEEHEALHLHRGLHEDEVWADARRKYSFVTLSLENDPAICSFCPIAKRLRN